MAWLCTGLAGPALAQQSPSVRSATFVDPRKTAKMHFGRVYVTPALAIERIGIDENVVNAAGDVSSDFVVIIDPSLTMWLPVSNRALVTTSLKSGVSYFKKHPDQSSLDPGIGVKGEFKIGRFVPFAERSYDQSRKRPSAEIEVRVPLNSVGTSAGIAYQPQSRSAIELSASRTAYTYGRDARYVGINLNTQLNRVEQGVTLRLDHRLTSLTAVHFLVENRQYKFSLAADRDAAGVRTLIGAEMGRKALLFGAAEIGYRTLTVARGSVPSINGLVASVSLTRQFQGASALTVNWSRDVNVSFLFDRPYYRSNATGMRIRQQLFRSFDAILALDRTTADYTKVPGESESPRVVTRSIGLDLGSRLNHGARIGFAVSRAWRSSDISSFRSFSGLRAGLSFSIGF